MYARLLCSLMIWFAGSQSLAAQGDPLPTDYSADCTWQPFAIFTTGYVKPPPPGSKTEPLYLRKEPSYAHILAGTEPFDWTNAACVLPPGMRLRIADWGKPRDRFAKVYYGGLIFWVSKSYRDGSPSLTSVTAETSSTARRKSAGRPARHRAPRRPD